VPLTLALVFTVAVLDKLIPEGSGDIGRAGIHLVSNLLVGIVTMEILRRRGRQIRQAQEAVQQTGAPDVAAAD
ncbi:MAG: hypothetical protein ACE5FD_16680, partial [Anaerolineae bacterium]